MDVVKTSYLDPAKLKPAPYNPRRIQKRMLAALKQSIRDFGFVEPMVVQKASMTIIGGHQRLMALREVCREDGSDVPRVPTVVLDVDDRTARRLNLALNKIQGDWNDDMLVDLLTELQVEPMSASEMLATGFTSQEIDRILQRTGGEGDGGDLRPFATSVTLSLQFADVAERDAVKALLAERVGKSGKKSGTIVRELLTNGAAH